MNDICCSIGIKLFYYCSCTHPILFLYITFLRPYLFHFLKFFHYWCINRVAQRGIIQSVLSNLLGLVAGEQSLYIYCSEFKLPSWKTKFNGSCYFKSEPLWYHGYQSRKWIGNTYKKAQTFVIQWNSLPYCLYFHFLLGSKVMILVFSRLIP